MAATIRNTLIRARNLGNVALKRPYHSQFHRQHVANRLSTLCGCISGGTVVWYLLKHDLKRTIDTEVFASKRDDERSTEKRALLQTQRELRFLSFASVEYDGNIYMSPQDFLESVTEESPRPRAGRRHYSRDEVDKFFKNTPTRNKGTTRMFRNLHDTGLISYTEYLFLLCVLTKPKSGFKIAFNMFDTDGNQRVDKGEFLVYESLITGSQHASGDRADSEGGTGAPVMDTTLTVHFFGRKGKDTLRYEDFHRFMDNLQTEVLELEFGEFAGGMPTITEVEFAQILMRYTILTADEHEEYMNRLRSRVTNVQGVTFLEFKEFCQFLNNLDDFALAMRMYTYANQPISQVDFKRAVKAVTGHSLSDHLVDVVFKLFDTDNDERLSHKEFISVMKDRLHRGFRNYSLPQNNWETFKSCVKKEMITS